MTTNKTSDHVKPCNIGQSEAHNSRSEAYLARINEKNIYVRRDLISHNQSWRSSKMQGRDLQQYYDDIARMVKEKTGRALQTKERKVVNKKTGRVKTISGSSPLRESVVVCKADTTMEQLQQYCEHCHEIFGITAIQIHIHRDEGHYENPRDKTSWKPNYHAHIVWDWMNHDTGKSLKLNADDMSRMQDMVAEALQMERGTSKTETSREHLERTDFIVAEQRRKSEKLASETQAKERISAELDDEIAKKQRQCDAESGNAILSGLANLAGRGKYAAIEKENERLKASVPKRLAELQRQFKAEVDKAVEQRTEPLRSECERYKTEYGGLVRKYNNIANRYNATLAERQDAEAALLEYKRGEKERFNAFASQTKWKDDILTVLALMFAKADQLFKQAVNAIVRFVRNPHQAIFTNEEATVIKATMTNFAGEHGDHRAVGKWLVLAAKADSNLSEREAAHAEREVDDVAIGRYDWRIKQHGGLKI